MKILSVRFQNIHSLKDEHILDFEHGTLGDAGLFVITGPTGSGKSTILDVITLALYNRIPRLGNAKISKNIIESEGVVLTKHADSCYAEVTYESKGRRYRSSWSISRNRNHNLNERVHELIDAETGEIILKGKDDVADKNTDIIGLSYEQFVQSLILAQGQFTKLLMAKRNERNTLLEKLTGAELYRQIGKHVFERYSSCNESVKHQELRMQGIAFLTEEERGAIEKELTELTPILEESQKKLATTQQLLGVKDELSKKEKALHAAKAALGELVQRAQEFNLVNETLVMQSKLSPFRDRRVTVKNTEKELSRVTEELKLTVTALSELKEQEHRLLERAAALAKRPLTPAEITPVLSGLLEDYEALSENLRALQQEKQTLETRHQRLSTSIQELHTFPLPTDADETKVLVEKLKNELVNFGAPDQDTLEKKQLELDLNIESARLASSIREHIDSEQEKIQTFVRQQSETKESLERFREQLPHVIKGIAAAEEKYDAEKKRLEQARVAQSLEDHRKALVEGEPCPLCGALEHPLGESLSSEFEATQQKLCLALIEKVDQLKQQRRELDVAIGKAQVQFDHFQKSMEESEAVVQRKEKEIADNLKKLNWQLTDDVSCWKSELEGWKTRKSALDEMRKKLQLIPLLNEYETNQTLASQLINRLNDFSEKRKQIFDGETFKQQVEEIKTNYRENAARAQLLTEQLQKQTTRKEQLSQALADETEALLSALKSIGVESLLAYDERLLPESEVEKLRQQLTDFTVQQTKLNTQVEQLTEQLAEQKKHDDPEVTREQVSQQLESTQEVVTEFNQKKGRLEEQINRDNNQRKTHQEAAALLQQLQVDRDLWKQMNKLIGDKYGHVFSNFVQDLTLGQLIDYANQRLLTFADRYQLTKPDKSDGDSPLQVLDTYMGNSRRSVTSLSGGETFKLSLALAFGLSDLAAQNVNIESLFIDEGFGTLDPESLDQAISILEKMQSEGNKSIGIISHVGELKERISAKIKLIRTGAGYSTIEIGN
jgi:DNA repair protein SbcC/Rad50